MTASGAEVDAEPRAPAHDAHHLGRLLAARRGARRDQRVPDRAGVLGVGDHVDAHVGHHEPHARARKGRDGVRVLGVGQAAAPATRRASGPTSESSARSSVRLCSSTSRPSL